MSVRTLIIPAGGFLFALAVVPAGVVRAQANPKPAAADTGVKADSRFIREITADNLLEVRLGQLAGKNASNSDVKQFGQRMVTDHTKLEDNWTSMASKNGLTFTPGLGRRHEQKIDRLEKLSGSNFDRSYMTMMVQQHQDDVDYLQNEGNAAHSTPVKDLIKSSLSVIQDHLNQARQIGVKVGADTATVHHRHVASRTKSSTTNQTKK